MVEFNYYTPTEIIFGANTEIKVGKLVKFYKGKKALVHYGGTSAKASGLLDKVFDSLEKAEIPFVSLGGVVANPVLSKVEEGIMLAKEEKIDFIVAVGGGSVIDSAKAIAVGAVSKEPIWSFVGNKNIDKALPVGAILTLAATGSEMSASVVITDEKTKLKRSFGGRGVRPVFAILNPELTYTLPQFQTAAGSADIIMHTVERYFTHAATMDITDGISERLIQNVIDHTKIVLKDPENYQSRAEIMWCGSLSHNGLTGARSDRGDWVSHKLGHELSAKYNIAHGASLTAIWAFWARYVYSSHKERFKSFAIDVMGVKEDEKSIDEIIEAGISKLETFFKEINLPTSLKDFPFKVTMADIEDMALKATNNNTSTPGNIKKLDYKDLINIFENANK